MVWFPTMVGGFSRVYGQDVSLNSSKYTHFCFHKRNKRQAGMRRAALPVSTSERVASIHNLRGSTIYQILCSHLWSHGMPRGPVVCGSSLEDL